MEIRTIIFGGVVANCYLLRTEMGFILIDTGRALQRKRLEKELEDAGCTPGNLNLVIITHGDFDHTGNCVYLRQKFATPIAMHRDDSGMVEYGDMFWNRKSGNIIARKMVNALFRISKFKPDLFLDEGFDLSRFGLDGRVLYLPGHSKGSIGILTTGGDLFCGDLLVNTSRPALSPIIDDKQEAKASVGRLKSLRITTVYPGHGKPFPLSALQV